MPSVPYNNPVFSLDSDDTFILVTSDSGNHIGILVVSSDQLSGRISRIIYWKNMNTQITPFFSNKKNEIMKSMPSESVPRPTALLPIPLQNEKQRKEAELDQADILDWPCLERRPRNCAWRSTSFWLALCDSFSDAPFAKQPSQIWVAQDNSECSTNWFFKQYFVRWYHLWRLWRRVSCVSGSKTKRRTTAFESSFWTHNIDCDGQRDRARGCSWEKRRDWRLRKSASKNDMRRSKLAILYNEWFK